MRLTQTEIDRVMLFSAAEMARRRRERGLKLNHPEAVARWIQERTRGAKFTGFASGRMCRS